MQKPKILLISEGITLFLCSLNWCETGLFYSPVLLKMFVHSSSNVTNVEFCIFIFANTEALCLNDFPGQLCSIGWLIVALPDQYARPHLPWHKKSKNRWLFSIAAKCFCPSVTDSHTFQWPKRVPCWCPSSRLQGPVALVTILIPDTVVCLLFYLKQFIGAYSHMWFQNDSLHTIFWFLLASHLSRFYSNFSESDF